MIAICSVKLISYLHDNGEYRKIFRSEDLAFISGLPMSGYRSRMFGKWGTDVVFWHV